MRKPDRYPPEELARRRAERYRALNRVENVPATYDFYSAIVASVREWLEEKGIRCPGDLVDASTGVARDRDAAKLVDRIVKSIVRKNFNINNPATRDKLWAILGLGYPPAPRSRHDEFDR